MTDMREQQKALFAFHAERLQRKLGRPGNGRRTATVARLLLQEEVSCESGTPLCYSLFEEDGSAYEVYGLPVTRCYTILVSHGGESAFLPDVARDFAVATRLFYQFSEGKVFPREAMEVMEELLS